MDRREREQLDRHITGNYGEDQTRPDWLMLEIVNCKCVHCGKLYTRTTRIDITIDREATLDANIVRCCVVCDARRRNRRQPK